MKGDSPTTATGSPAPVLTYPPMDTAADGLSQQGIPPAGQLVQSADDQQKQLHPLAPRWPPTTTDSTYVFWPGPLGKGRNAATSALAGANANGNSGDDGLSQALVSRQKTAQDVYGSVMAPYDYTAGYHSLMKYLPHR